MRKVEGKLLGLWKEAQDENKRFFPFEFMFQLIKRGSFKKDSWLVVACEKNIPVFVPGWEDSRLGNFFISNIRKNKIKNISLVKSGLETMDALINWYLNASRESDIGFFQIGGGISGDFAISVVPLIRQDLQVEDCKLWSYFCRVSDSTTSYGSYSGAIPNEK
jgi:deoxyhypusine synthase